MDRLEADRRLLESIRRDDPAAFEEFVRRYGGRIFGFGMRVCGEPVKALYETVSPATLMLPFWTPFT